MECQDELEKCVTKCRRRVGGRRGKPSTHSWAGVQVQLIVEGRMKMPARKLRSSCNMRILSRISRLAAVDFARGDEP